MERSVRKMQSKKIGIITHYYCSKNYGGNLQAYALCKVIQDLGYDVEQICYKRWEDPPLWHKKKNITSVMRVIKRTLYSFMQLPNAFHIDAKRNIKLRERCILDFNSKFIPHSAKEYTHQTIDAANEEYDVFITGSDQVWHPQAVCKAFLLDFVKKEKTKISYAASLSVNELTDEQRKKYQQSLSDYSAISVREKNAVELLEPIASSIPQWVLDPTMLLTCEQWDLLCSARQISEPYVFCYFLGDDKKQRKVAEEFAVLKGLKLVTLPYLMGKYRQCDRNFGDEMLYNVSPADYISLIKFADYVFTDSFHATAFSLLYKRDFFAFDRIKAKGMGSRLHSVTSLFGVEERFYNTTENVFAKQLVTMKPIDYTNTFDKFNIMKEQSISFLKKNIEKSK